MRLAILTCDEYPSFTPDDRLAVAALQADGIEVVPWLWDAGQPHDVDAIVVRSPWDYYRRPEVFSRWLRDAESSGIPLLNCAELIRWNLPKRYLLGMQQMGAPIVPTQLWERGSQGVPEALAEGEWDDLVVKPEVAAGAFRTFRLRRGSILSRREEIESILKEGALLAQPFLPSIETEGEISLVYFASPEGVYFSHGLRKRAKAGDFRVQEKFGGSIVADTGGPEWQAAAEAALATVPHPFLYARVDLVKYEGQPVLGEMEVFEPELFFRLAPQSPSLFSKCLQGWLANA